MSRWRSWRRRRHKRIGLADLRGKQSTRNREEAAIAFEIHRGETRAEDLNLVKKAAVAESNVSDHWMRGWAVILSGPQGEGEDAEEENGGLHGQIAWRIQREQTSRTGL
jgi:hypothetical protein